MRVNRADLMHRYKQMQDELEKFRALIRKRQAEIVAADAEDPTLKEGFFEKYKKARLEVGLDVEDIENSFMRYMADEHDLDFDINAPE